VSQRSVISGGGFQDALGNPLVLGYVIVALQQDVNVGVNLCAGIKATLSLDTSGNVTGDPTLWGSVTYLMTAYSAEGQRVWHGTITVPDVSAFSLTP
jgi:hypothetical protein